MIIILLGKPLVFWFGIIALLSLSLQIYLGARMMKGHPEFLKYHKLNAATLCFIVGVHLILGLLLYL
jgi:hypothetical protein